MTTRRPQSPRDCNGDGHDPALALLADLPPATTLTPAAQRRIAAELGELASPASRGWQLGLPLATAALVLLGWLGLRQHHHLRQSAASARQELQVPACGVSRVAQADGHYRGAFVGPATATVASDGTIALGAGRAVIATEGDAVAVATPDARVAVAAHSLVEIVVRDYRAVRVATFQGRAQLATGGGVPVVLAGGDAWDASGLASRATTADADAARRLVAPDACELPVCPAATPSAAVASSPPKRAIAPPPPPATTTRRRAAIEPGPHEPTLAIAATPPVVAAEPTTASRASIAATSRPPIAAPAPTPTAATAPPAPTATAAPTSSAPPAPSAAEVTLLGDALQQLRQRHDARAALMRLDRLEAEHPHGDFATEVRLVRIEALRQLGQWRAALALLDGLPLVDEPRSGELLLLRAELRARQGRHREAADDYTDAMSRQGVSEQALVGRATARFHAADDRGARDDLAAYLARYPDGRYAAEARRALGR